MRHDGDFRSPPPDPSCRGPSHLTAGDHLGGQRHRSRELEVIPPVVQSDLNRGLHSYPPPRDMPDYREQTDRIKDKLERARTADPAFLVFGAPSHRYEIGPPLDEGEVAEFEETYQVSLPGCFRSFLTARSGTEGPWPPVSSSIREGIYPLTEQEMRCVREEQQRHRQSRGTEVPGQDQERHPRRPEVCRRAGPWSLAA